MTVIERLLLTASRDCCVLAVRMLGRIYAEQNNDPAASTVCETMAATLMYPELLDSASALVRGAAGILEDMSTGSTVAWDAQERVWYMDHHDRLLGGPFVVDGAAQGEAASPVQLLADLHLLSPTGIRVGTREGYAMTGEGRTLLNQMEFEDHPNAPLTKPGGTDAAGPGELAAPGPDLPPPGHS